MEQITLNISLVVTLTKRPGEDSTDDEWYAEVSSPRLVRESINVPNRLSSLLDHTQPLDQWQPYTFPQVCTLLGIKPRTNSAEHRQAKRALIHWLQSITADSVIKEPKTRGTSWSCLLPPLKTKPNTN